MKKFIALFASIFAVTLVCSLFTSAATLKINVDFSGMEANDILTAEDIGAYRIENIKIAEFNAEGNILVAKNNGAPSYLIYKICADEGKLLSSLTIKSYASVNDWEVDGAPLAGNEFGIYVKSTDDFDFESDTPADGASGMVGKKNHTWKLDEYVNGKSEIYVCIYFLNNSSFIDWVRFYSFDFSAAEKINAPATSSSDTESQPESTTSMGSGTETDNNASIISGTNDDSTDTSDIIDPEEKNTNLIAITLIAVAAIAAVIVVVAMIKVAKSNKTD